MLPISRLAAIISQSSPGGATSFTLSGSTSGTTNSPSTLTVTPNGPLLSTTTVTITAPNSTLSTSSLSFTSGSSTPQTFTVTRTTDGTTSVSITNSAGLSNLGTPFSYTSTVFNPLGAEPVPVFQKAKSYDNASAFTTTLTSADAGEQFDVGTGPSTGIVVRVIASTHAATIDSFVIGGVALTALTQTTLSGWSANERVFYGVGLSLTGLQSWTAAVSAGARINVQIFAARSAVAFTAGPIISVLSNTLSQTITQDANTLTVGMLTSNHDSGTLNVKGGTYEKWTRVGNFYKDVIVTDPANAISIDAVITGGLFTFSWLGRVCYLQGAVAAAPSWIPAIGEMGILTVANGKLANNFRSQCASYYEEFYYVKTSNTYGGAFKNPYWGTYGATVYFSGGHANTNDNTVTIAEYGATQVTFKRAVDPTPWFGTGTDSTTRGENSANITTNQFMDVTSAGPPVVFDYGISTIDGKPGSSHTYGSGDCIGPDNGFASAGTYFRVLTPALNRQNQYGAISALAVDFNSTTELSSSRSWYKHSLARRNESGQGSAPILTQFVGPQNRIYMVTNGNAVIRWYDIQAGAYVDGSGTGFGYDNADGFDGGTMFYVPSRGLLICAYRESGNITIQWMDVTVQQPTLGGTATLSVILAVADPWGGATWCPDNNRIILGSITGNDDAMYEVEIPTTLSSTWNVTRVPLGNGQTWPVMNTSGEFKRFHYDERIKAIFYLQSARRADQGEDVAYVYKPRITVPALQLTGSSWTPNVDGGGNVLTTDYSQLPQSWVNVVTNKIDDLVPTGLYPTGSRYGTLVSGTDGLHSVINAWSGAAWDWVNGRMYIAGGGHNDSWGTENGVYKFDTLNMRFSTAVSRGAYTDARYWHGGPSVTTGEHPSGNDYPQGNGGPPAMHTYHSIRWIPGSRFEGNTNGYFLQYAPGGASGTLCIANLDTGTWKPAWWKDDYSTGKDFSYAASFVEWPYMWSMGLGSPSYYYAEVFDLSQTETTTYNVASQGKELATASGFNMAYGERANCQMETRREMVNFGNHSGTLVIHRYRLGAAADAAVVFDVSSYEDTITLTGDASDFTASAFSQDTGGGVRGIFCEAGMAYDADADCLWIVPNPAGSATYKLTGLNTNVWTVTKYASGTTLTRSPVDSDNGTYGRVRCFKRGGVRFLLRVVSTTGYAQVRRCPDN